VKAANHLHRPCDPHASELRRASETEPGEQHLEGDELRWHLNADNVLLLKKRFLDERGKGYDSTRA
jgi:hypothetical protein